MNLDLTAVYRRNLDDTWDATIKGFPFISVENAEDLDSARTLLELHTAEELSDPQYERTVWSIEDEEII